ncbi:MAG: type II secretion system protein GspJ [Pelagibaca sp.]
MTSKRHHETGVTLIEMLVSLAIFAVIGIAGLTVLDTVATTGERTEGRLERLAEIDRAFLVIRRDLAQITGMDTRLNTDGLAFQRLDSDSAVGVTYKFENSVLTRGIEQTDPSSTDQHLLNDVSDMRWRLLDQSQSWTSLWPPEGTSDPRRPLAAELTLDVNREGFERPQRITRIFTLPAGQGR